MKDLLILIKILKHNSFILYKNEFYKSLIKKNLFLSDNKFHDNQWGIIIIKHL